MSEVLSQNQIDALLSAMRSGEKPPDSEGVDKQEKRYRKYDFYSPRKFTKDRLKMLNGVFENYTRMITSRINGWLHTTCEIEVESVEEQRYYEFSNALTDGDVLALAGVTFEDGSAASDDSPVLLHFSNSLMLSMMDRLMGGAGDVDPRLPTEYHFTDLELRLYEIIAKNLIPSLGTSWENYLELTFQFRRMENNPTLVQLIGLDETVVIVSFNLKFPNCAGRMSVCLPGMMLTNIFTKMSAANQGGRSGAENHQKEILDVLRESDLEIIAELGRTTVELRDVYHLNVGDVIDLGHAKDEPIYLYIGGSPWFSGKMGAYKNSVAIKIGDVCHKQGREVV